MRWFILIIVALVHIHKCKGVCEFCNPIPLEFVYPPTQMPTGRPTNSFNPTFAPTLQPSTRNPTPEPSTRDPTVQPSTQKPTPVPSTQKPTPLPTTQKPTPLPSTQKPTPVPSTPSPTFQPENILNILNFGQCTESTNIVTCPGGTWTTSSNTNTDVLGFANLVALRRGAILSITVDTSLFSTIEEFSLDLAATGILEPGDYCTLSYSTTGLGGPFIELTEVRVGTDGVDNSGRLTFELGVVDVAATNELSIRIQAVTNTNSEYCDLYSFRVTGRPNGATASPTLECTSQFSACGGINLCGSDIACRSCCYPNGVCIRANPFYFQCLT